MSPPADCMYGQLLCCLYISVCRLPYGPDATVLHRAKATTRARGLCGYGNGCVLLLPLPHCLHCSPHALMPPQELVLRCELHPAAVPLLARLPHLARLTLFLPCDRNLDDWSSSSTVAATCLTPLLLGAPSLKSVHVEFQHQDCDGHDDREPPEFALLDGVMWVRAQLQRLGRDPRMITMETHGV